MAGNSSKKKNVFLQEVISWLVIVVLLSFAILVNVFFNKQPFLYRFLAIISFFILSIVFFVYFTNLGFKFRILFQGAIFELRKVVWPTRAEALQTTLMAIIFVAIFGLILWLLDTFMAFFINLFLNL